MLDCCLIVNTEKIILYGLQEDSPLSATRLVLVCTDCCLFVNTEKIILYGLQEDSPLSATRLVLVCTDTQT